MKNLNKRALGFNVVLFSLCVVLCSGRLVAQTEVAIFGGGCFWCVEAVFQEVKGVESVMPGYTGGQVENPTYKEVCTGNTGHAEVAKIIFNPSEVTFEELLYIFFQTHDPTTLNYQGNDHGTQYRSAIFYTSEAQRISAEGVIQKLNEAGAYSKKIVTKVEELTIFYPAENYHDNYYANNPDAGYCRYVITPKMEKFRKAFKDFLKP